MKAQLLSFRRLAYYQLTSIPLSLSLQHLPNLKGKSFCKSQADRFASLSWMTMELAFAMRSLARSPLAALACVSSNLENFLLK